MRAALRAEGRLLYTAFTGAAKPVFVGVGAAALLWILVALVTGDIATTSIREALLVAIIGLGYAAFVGGIAAIVAGMVRMVWFMVGGWIALPFVLVPAFAWLTLWLFADFLHAQLDDVGAALMVAGAEHDWLVQALGPAARIGPPILIIALPLLAIDVGAIMLDPRVLWELAIMAFDVVFVLALGTVLPMIASAVVLAIVYVHRFRRRHRATAA